MIFGKSRLELKVGIFVFIGLVILVIFILLIGNFKTILMSHQVNFLFSFTNGIKIGAPIRFAGVDIGEVKGLNFFYNAPEGSAKVLISGWIRNDVRIPRDSRVWINTLGLLGEKYLEIMPGKNYADLVKKGDNMAGIDPMASHEIVDVIKNMVADVDQTFVRINNKEGTVGKLLFDDALYNQMVSTTKELQTSITTLTQGFDGLISDIRAHPWKLFFRDKEKPQKR